MDDNLGFGRIYLFTWQKSWFNFICFKWQCRKSQTSYIAWKVLNNYIFYLNCVRKNESHQFHLKHWTYIWNVCPLSSLSKWSLRNILKSVLGLLLEYSYSDNQIAWHLISAAEVLKIWVSVCWLRPQLAVLILHKFQVLLNFVVIPFFLLFWNNWNKIPLREKNTAEFRFIWFWWVSSHSKCNLRRLLFHPIMLRSSYTSWISCSLAWGQ